MPLLITHSQLVVIGMVSGAPLSPPPAATSIGRGTLTGSLVICCYIIGYQMSCIVVYGPEALSAHVERSKMIATQNRKLRCATKNTIYTFVC